eukprot:CAMPEP_0178907678 /NCGR_PEP_ID=MMETSP0786-20121207/7504_1 /TAXON_ID=186022 /ORGANISM="Thalassionema frauenfeldii, Strain CCMP 1798" /LENGTH=807 /DNA_ID=CAMNT_0020579503 /DNA_START=386 /DNA_END=2812 /DNA_ORIENTATION=+
MSDDLAPRATRASTRASMAEKEGSQLFLMPSPAHTPVTDALQAASATSPQHQSTILEKKTLLEKHTTASPTNIPPVRPKVVTSTPSISIQPTVDLAKYEMETYKPQEVEPHDKDVLCGRGGLTNYHPGNSWYRNMVRANRSLYKASPKHSKILVAKSICGHVLAQGSRFLECDKRTGSWFTISYKRAVDKTSQALREKDRYSEDQESEVNPIFASRAKGPFSIITHPPPDSNAPPRFIEDIKKRQLLDAKEGDTKESTGESSSNKNGPARKKPKLPSAKADRSKSNKQSKQSKKSNETSNGETSNQMDSSAPSESTVDAAVAVMASRMGAINGLNGTTPSNGVDANLAAISSLNQDQAAAYIFAQNVMQQSLPHAQTLQERERLAQLSSLFWQRANSANGMKSNDSSSIYGAHSSLAKFSILQQQNAALQNAALQKLSQQSPGQIAPTNPDDPTTLKLDSSVTAKAAILESSSQLKQFLQDKAPTSEKVPETNDQFADSQEDQFADPEDEDGQAPPEVNEKQSEGKIPPETSENSVADKEDEATAAMAMVQFAATTKKESSEATSPASTKATPCVSISCQVAGKASTEATEDDNLKFGPICRVCKTSIMFRDHVPNPSLMNPELIWIDHGAPVTSPSMRHIVDMVHGHCRTHHPHWPLWNVLMPVGLDMPTAMNVFHRALAASAAALPHTSGDTYDSVHELCYRIGHRIGLAKGWVWWFPWQDANQNSITNYHALCAASKSTATKLLVDYERAFIQAICESWEKLAEMTHQERLDIYNNFFSVPYCIETLRVKGNLFPPVHPTGQKG